MKKSAIQKMKPSNPGRAAQNRYIAKIFRSKTDQT
jgi:hypothetical protein